MNEQDMAFFARGQFNLAILVKVIGREHSVFLADGLVVDARAAAFD